MGIANLREVSAAHKFPRVLIIQENGRHNRNRQFRECYSVQRALAHLGIHADVWGKGHANFGYSFDRMYPNYDLFLSLENYDDGWHPDLSQVKKPTAFWCVDAHIGAERYLEFVRRNRFDLVFNSTPGFVDRFKPYCAKSIWLPNAYDHFLIDRMNDVARTIPFGFCGNIVNRNEWIDDLKKSCDLHHDQMVIGPDMVRAVNSYRIHWNRNVSCDINYRTFETLGCGTFLLTNYTPGLEKLFRIDKHLVIYKDRQDLVDKVTYFSKNREAREQIARAGYHYVKTHHTYLHRVGKIIETTELLNMDTLIEPPVEAVRKNDRHVISKQLMNCRDSAVLDESETCRDLARSSEWLGYMAGQELEKQRQVSLDDFGGSSIRRWCFEWIIRNLRPASRILELGSGAGSTQNLSHFYRLFSVEDQLKYVDRYDSIYIYAPLVNGWYDVEILKNNLPTAYDLILVDGPTGEGQRWGFYHHLGLFDTSVPIVFDDIWRRSEREMMIKVGKKLNKEPLLFKDWNDFGVIV